jgi:hypothetical protein
VIRECECNDRREREGGGRGRLGVTAADRFVFFVEWHSLMRVLREPKKGATSGGAGLGACDGRPFPLNRPITDAGVAHSADDVSNDLMRGCK